jgi:hypothetical protein
MILLSFEGAILEFLLTHAPFLLIVLVLIAASIWGTIRVMRFIQKVEKTKENCDDLRKRYIPDLHNKYTSIDTQIKAVHISITKISTFLTTKQGFTNNIFEAKSPIELTELGKTLLTLFGGEEYVNTNAASLVEEIERREPKSGLDVQNYANVVLIEKSLEDGFTHIKNYIFQNPIYRVSDSQEVTLDLGLVTQIMGIYLRNKYFEKYPDLKSDL